MRFRSVLWWTTRVALAVTAYEVAKAFVVARKVVSENFSFFDGPDAVCRITETFLTTRSLCQYATKIKTTGYVFSVFVETVERTNWCLGYSCTDAMHDARSALYVVGAFGMYVVWQSDVVRIAAKKWQRQRQAKKFEREMARAITE
jgi:hypothetical protein